MHLEIRIVPNAKRFSVSLKDGITKIYVAAKAENNEANAELVEKLSEALATKVEIAKGTKTRTKVLLECIVPKILLYFSDKRHCRGISPYPRIDKKNQPPYRLSIFAD